MKLLVAICQTPDTTAKIDFTDGNTKFNTNGVQYILNPTDEWYALVRAIELKEQLGGTVTVINVGLADADQNIRKALAIGADDAVRINADPAECDAYVIAGHIADYAQGKNFDLIFTGKETIDYNGYSVPSILAELLDLPHVSLAMRLDIANNAATIDREIEGGVEKVKVSLPCLVSAQKGMAEQRIPNMKGIMSARSKKLEVIQPKPIVPLCRVQIFELPPQAKHTKMIAADNPEELVRLLREEAKAI